MILWLDTETYSECDLKTAGTHRYTAHYSTEIIVAQWALGDEDPHVVDCAVHGGRWCPPRLRLALADPLITLAASNSHFDRTVMREVWGLDVPPERWFDPMVQALAHGLPGALGKYGEAMGLPIDARKDKRGRDLVRLFCMPRPKSAKLRRATRGTHPQEWAEFLEYSRQDIVAMRAASKAMPDWNYNLREGSAGHREWQLWCLDQRVNDRGFAVDLDLAHAAIRATDAERERLRADMSDATLGEVAAPSQRDELIRHILKTHGVALPDMRADTLRRRIDDPELPQAVRNLLEIRLEATKTSTAKFRTLVAATDTDGRLRNAMQFAGAQRTARWAHRLFQPGNMPRPTLEQWEIDDGIVALKAGCAELVSDNITELAANCVRSCIVAPPGGQIVQADLANIEGRVLAWLAGETWKLQAFRDYDAGTGPDLYRLAYARAFAVPHETVTKYQRQIGKVQELMLGYEGGVGAYITGAVTYGIDLDDMAVAVLSTAPQDAILAAEGMWAWAERNKRILGLSRRVYVACEVLKAGWRANHPATVQLWRDLGDAFRRCVAVEGLTIDVGQHLRMRRDGAWLRLRLPSGRCLCYLQPRVSAGGVCSYVGVSQYTKQWSRIGTYGGKLCVAGGTLVLTHKGWTTIEEVSSVDQVWDGDNWVATGGAVFNGERKVICAHGAWMTPDHLVLTTQGWVSASSSEGHYRAACRLPDGVALPGQRRQKIDLADRVRLRARSENAGDGIAETSFPQSYSIVRLHARRNDCEQDQNPRPDATSTVRGMAQHARTLFEPQSRCVAQLWRAWHYSVQALAHVRIVLCRRWADLLAWPIARSAQQRAGVFAPELAMGNAGRAGQQYPFEPHSWRNDCGATGLKAWGKAVNDVLPTRGGSAAGAIGRSAGYVAPVFDLIDCGPQHRFTILADGAPLIVHNCENATQAVARDVLAYNMPGVEAAGFEIVLSIHDELLTDTTPGRTAEELSALMTAPLDWSAGLPLAAAGFVTDRYRKE